jgi:hypothetical protein
MRNLFMPLLHPGAPFPELSLTRLRLEPGQAVVPHGIDDDLTTGEMHSREQR